MLDSHYPNGMTHGDLQHVGELPNDQVQREVVLLSEIDFSKETETFDTESEAIHAQEDNLELIDLKISQLVKIRDEISLQLIRKVVE
ncbi:hypothetical protein [Leuconostoc citreum]|uniref:hypothetical protein n=1 Tax=Leuconostoc citreum TaxID=33964 RepID=UPI001F0F676F|nr:hypothetical protein [Leuconostoc citreum]